MSTIFISHSRSDAELVDAIRKVLENVDHTAIIEEFIANEDKNQPPFEEIRNRVEICDIVFLFLTDNVVSKEHTKSWVMFEVGLAAKDRKKLYVFERSGVPIEYPIPYLTDYMIFDKDNTSDILDIQTLAKKTGKIHPGILGAGGGALAGLVAGPIGILIGALAGGAIGATFAQQSFKTKCENCGIEFNYHSLKYSRIKCPACRKMMIIERKAQK